MESFDKIPNLQSILENSGYGHLDSTSCDSYTVGNVTEFEIPIPKEDEKVIRALVCELHTRLPITQIKDYKLAKNMARVDLVTYKDSKEMPTNEGESIFDFCDSGDPGASVQDFLNEFKMNISLNDLKKFQDSAPGKELYGVYICTTPTFKISHKHEPPAAWWIYYNIPTRGDTSIGKAIPINISFEDTNVEEKKHVKICRTRPSHPKDALFFHDQNITAIRSTDYGCLEVFSDKPITKSVVNLHRSYNCKCIDDYINDKEGGWKRYVAVDAFKN